MSKRYTHRYSESCLCSECHERWTNAIFKLAFKSKRRRKRAKR